MPDLATKRACVQGLLNAHSPADAIATYYALHHDPERTCLFLHHDTDGRTDGFLVRSQTGMDLFTPIVTMRAPSEQAAGALVHSALIAGRPYYLLLPLALEAMAGRELEVSASERLRVYCLRPAHFRPTINALVQPGTGPNSTPRFEIRSEQQVLSAAGVIWRSPHFAEISVSTVPEARGRGWGRSVVAALAKELLLTGVQPLYITSEDNQSSIHVADAVGFIDTGARMFSGSA
ncbi:MAG: GNAT family N-acetyltransferase, partial [Anaerolineales bacterium]|nr:GNAT family N-acetyltransferase [Anaerolineales bacterium]